MPRAGDENGQRVQDNPALDDSATLSEYEKAYIKELTKELKNTFQSLLDDVKANRKSNENQERSLSDLEKEQARTDSELQSLNKALKDQGYSQEKIDSINADIKRQKAENLQLARVEASVNYLNNQLQKQYPYKNRHDYNEHVVKDRTSVWYDPEKGEYITVENTPEMKQKAAAELDNEAAAKNMAQVLKNTFKNLFNEINNKVNGTIEKYAEYQSSINTRLQGTAKNFQKAEEQLTKAMGVQPYFKTQSLLDNLQSLVGQGIAFNVEQRAFLETISEKIATTFDVANASLLRIVRLQQADSTAARLGMEAALTSYLNRMFEDTSYLNSEFDTVQEALIEASALMTTQSSMAFEYQVQKWLGSLSSLGMSDSTVTAIGQALGYLGSGNISALSGSNIQNLLAIAANRSGLSYGSLISSGLDETTTNILLRSIVEYLQEIAVSTNNAARSEIAQQFGVTVSDLVSALSLSSSTLDQLSKKSMSYEQDIQELGRQLNQVASRTSVAGLIDTAWENVFFSIASNIASNPALAAIWKVTDLIQSYTGGINIPTNEFGNIVEGQKEQTGTGILTLPDGTGTVSNMMFEDPEYDTNWLDMETTVENLIKLGVIGAGTLGSIGDIISGIGNTIKPNSMLAKMGISSSVIARSGVNSITKGGGLEALISGLDTSTSTYIGTSGSALYDSTMASIEDMKAQQISSSSTQSQAAQEEEEVKELRRKQTNTLDSTNSIVKDIYDILHSWDTTSGVPINTGTSN